MHKMTQELNWNYKQWNPGGLRSDQPCKKRNIKTRQNKQQQKTMKRPAAFESAGNRDDKRKKSLKHRQMQSVLGRQPQESLFPPVQSYPLGHQSDDHWQYLALLSEDTSLHLPQEQPENLNLLKRISQHLQYEFRYFQLFNIQLWVGMHSLLFVMGCLGCSFSSNN